MKTAKYLASRQSPQTGLCKRKKRGLNLGDFGPFLVLLLAKGGYVTFRFPCFITWDLLYNALRPIYKLLPMIAIASFLGIFRNRHTSGKWITILRPIWTFRERAIAVPTLLYPEPWKSRHLCLRFGTVEQRGFSPGVRGYMNSGSAIKPGYSEVKGLRFYKSAKRKHAKPVDPHLDLRAQAQERAGIIPALSLVKPRRLCGFGFHVHNPPKS
jgi:hypothetical protein